MQSWSRCHSLRGGSDSPEQEWEALTLSYSPSHRLSQTACSYRVQRRRLINTRMTRTPDAMARMSLKPQHLHDAPRPMTRLDLSNPISPNVDNLMRRRPAGIPFSNMNKERARLPSSRNLIRQKAEANAVNVHATRAQASMSTPFSC